MLKIKQILTSPYRGYQTMIRWYGVIPVVVALLVIFICSVVIIYKATQDENGEPDKERALATVTTTTANAYQADFSGTLIGTAVAKTEATLITETGGQVTSVNVNLGQTVAAGTILAQFENAIERASLTQARGAYESALASAQQSTISVTDAKNAVTDSKRDLLSAHNNAQASVTSIIVGSIDPFYSNPNGANPTLRISAYSYTNQLNNLRVTLRQQLEAWQQNTTALTINDNLDPALSLANDTIQKTIFAVDTFITIFQQKDGDDQYSLEDYRNFITDFTTLRTNLNSIANSLSSAKSNLTSAEENVARAELSGGNTSSLSSAQITQARGALLAAEANYNKTIIRTPIAGTVATLTVRAGDHISPQTLVAKITNTDGVEITTYISESERPYFTVGDEIIINQTATGTISAISPTIDSRTQKIEVRIAVSDDSISPGSTVSLALPKYNQTSSAVDQPITVPITAIKFTNTNGVIFVVENNILIAKPVTLGEVSGTKVTILSGIDNNTEFVVDARGKIAGEEVEIINK